MDVQNDTDRPRPLSQRGDRRQRRTLLALLVLTLAACGSSQGSADAVLVVEDIEEGKCGDEPCLTVVVTNQGPEAGSGHCILSGVGHDYKENGMNGPRIEVPKLEPRQSETFVRAVTLTTKERDRLLQWSSSCSPGPEG